MIAEKEEHVKPKMFTHTVSVYKNSFDTIGATFSIETIRKRIKDGRKGLAKKTEKCRYLAKNDKKAYKDFKEANLPAPTFAGIFPPGKRQARSIKQHSGLIVLDFDDIPDIPSLLVELSQRPEIVIGFISPSGNGVKIVVPLNPIPQNASEHSFAFRQCQQNFQNLKDEHDFTFDTSGKDCSRLCYLAHYPHVIGSSHALPITWDHKEYLKVQERQESELNNTDFTGKVDIKALDYIPPDTYEMWISVGFACHNADVPLTVWDNWSKNSDKYKEGECPTKWKSFENNYDGRKLTWGSVVHYAKQNGYVPPKNYTSPKRLNINPTEQDQYKAILIPPEETYNTLNKNTNQFILNCNNSKNTKITILKFHTGAGKNHSLLTNAKKHGKKIISLFANHELATEQTNEAHTHGFTPYRFKGRGYNFRQSKLNLLPRNMRKQDETLFRKYQIMCPVYDEIERHQQKRLSPWSLCIKCPLLETCKQEGYWSQFSEMRNADFVSVCLQTILFNPDFWTLLNILLTGALPFDTTETPEETTIAYMLGLNTNTEDTIEFQNFDFAVIDDYTTTNLYTESTYHIDEFATLADVWKDTITGEVMEKLLNAFVFLMKKDTQESVEKIKILLENIDDETKTTINENLTKHAIRDKNGYVTTISPWTALKNGYTLDTLTPVWHSQDWTILHQLEATLKNCNNINQAPIFLRDNKWITLSIPPQLPPKIKDILLMSATADIESTKNAFIGQNVSFITAEGKPTQLANGVKLFQYTDARWTTQSMFEYMKNEYGKTIYNEDGKPTIQALKPRAIELIQKLITLAKLDNRKKLFTSIKEFTEQPIADLDIVKELHDAFDTISHYDLISGKNFEDYKIFINLGYPKVDSRDIEREARIQYRHDPIPLNFNYDETTGEYNGYTSQQARYTDLRLDKIRQQLTTLKLQQTTGRSRPTRWEDTITINICAEPVPSFTEIATPFTYQQLMNTECFDLDNAIQKDNQNALTAENTIEEFQKYYGCSRRHAHRLWEKAGGKQKQQKQIDQVLQLKSKGISIRDIAKQLGLSKGKVEHILKKQEERS